jgi:hypothetical protein
VDQDDDNISAADVTAFLDETPEAAARVERGLAEALRGETVSLDDL